MASRERVHDAAAPERPPPSFALVGDQDDGVREHVDGAGPAAGATAVDESAPEALEFTSSDAVLSVAGLSAAPLVHHITGRELFNPTAWGDRKPPE